MKKEQWQQAFGRAPESFRRQLRSTLNDLEDRKMKKRRKFTTALIAAAVAVVLIVGAGVAGGSLNVFSMLNTADPIVPLEGAGTLVEAGLGSVKNDLVSLSVEEAVYDGQGAIVQLRLSPLDPENYALMSEMLQEDESEYDVRYMAVEGDDGAKIADEGGEWEVTYEDGEAVLIRDGERMAVPEDPETARQLGVPVFWEDGALVYADAGVRILSRKDGKSIIQYSVGIDGNEAAGGGAAGEEIFFDTWNAEAQADGSVLIWASAVFEQPMPDQIALEVNCKLNLYAGDAESGEISLKEVPLDSMIIQLEKKEQAQEARLEPVGDGKGERFQILSGEVSFTKVRGYLTIDYTYTQAEGEDMGITMRLYDADGNRIATGSGATQTLTAEDGSVYYRQQEEIQSFGEIPKTLWLEAKVIGEDRTLGRVECRLSTDD